MRSVSLAIVFLGACATSELPVQPAPQVAAVPAASIGSSLGHDELASAGSGPKGKPLPVLRWERTSDAVDLSLRPDVLTADFAIREVRATSVDAMAASRQTCSQLAARLTERVGRPVRLTPRGVEAEPIVPDTRAVPVVVSGVIEVDLPGEWDFWSRSQLFITVDEVTTAVADESSRNPASTVRFDGLTAGLKNPELYRPLLIERWVAQARGFSSQAQTKEVPLALVNCTPPGSVTQIPVSVEEARLQLAVNCRIDVPTVSPRAAEPVPPPAPAPASRRGVAF